MALPKKWNRYPLRGNFPRGGPFERMLRIPRKGHELALVGDSSAFETTTAIVGYGTVSLDQMVLEAVLFESATAEVTQMVLEAVMYDTAANAIIYQNGIEALVRETGMRLIQMVIEVVLPVPVLTYAQIFQVGIEVMTYPNNRIDPPTVPAYDPP